MPDNPEQIRSFIAVELPDEVKEGLVRLRGELGSDKHRFVKWVSPEGVHLTIKFLGNIASGRVNDITQAMEEASRGITPFSLEIAGLGAFPNLRQARVLWVGVAGEIDKLSELQRRIDSALVARGFAAEDRPFVPHLTLARIRQGTSPQERKSFGQVVESTMFEDRYRVQVDDVSLMKSQLTPVGAVYTRLSLVRLGP